MKKSISSKKIDNPINPINPINSKSKVDQIM